ncbi:MAG: hypothetical protein WBD87_04395 [Candidatus Acidiferrales bacterium]
MESSLTEIESNDGWICGGTAMTYVWANTYQFTRRESAARFRDELRRMGLWSSLSVPSGGSYSYGVTILDETSFVPSSLGRKMC